MFKKIIRYCNKENFDFSTGNIDAFDFHEVFCMFMKSFGFIKSELKGIWITIFILTITTSDTLHFILMNITLYYAIRILDIALITEASLFVLLMAYLLIILASLKLNFCQYNRLLESLKHDFHYICNEGAKYRERYFKNELVTWKMCLGCVIFTLAMGLSMCIFQIISSVVYCATHKAGERVQKPLLYPYWLFGYDYNVEPIYSILLFLNVTLILFYSYTYVFMVQTQILWIRHLAAKIDIVVWNLEDLLEDTYQPTNEFEMKQFLDLIKKRMKQIIIFHQSMYSLLDAYAAVYKKMLMFEQTVTAPLTCMTAYSFVLKWDDGEFNASFIILCFSIIVQVFIPNYLCTFLSMKVQSVCDACFSVPFWMIGPTIRPYLVLMMQRSLRPLPLRAVGFEEISLKTFSSKMASAYSMFNMLRQINL
uniref:Odorant receptor n=1 Tax=Eogystia hippophaecolus TaxID=1206364 RepID=A0A1B3P5N7_EOGHI|nr:odorant receptor [Eogystia hippophaecolus]